MKIHDTTLLKQRSLNFKQRTPIEKRFHKYYNDKKKSSENRGIPFNLSHDDMWQLLNEAGITPFDIGRLPDEFCLARYEDTGPYEIGNCQFTTNAQNLLEQDPYRWWNSLSDEEKHQHRIRHKK